jgi:hypothetical protein
MFIGAIFLAKYVDDKTITTADQVNVTEKYLNNLNDRLEKA